MPEKEPGRGDPLGPLDWRKMFPFEQAAARDRPGWMGLGAAHYRPEPVFERNVPALTHHRLFLVIRPPEELDLRYEGVKRHVPPPAGAIMLVPAGSPAWARSSGYKDALHIFLEPGLVARVAAEAFGLDPARLTVPPLDILDLPHLRAAMGAVDAELISGGAGGPLAAESLANVLAVHLIRHCLAPRRPERRCAGARRGGGPGRGAEYTEGPLAPAQPGGRSAPVPRLSPSHFARQFRAATGLPPHQYVIARRVERARHLLQAGTGLSLAEVAAHA